MTAINEADYVGTLGERSKLAIPTEATAAFFGQDPETGELVEATETRETLEACLGVQVELDLLCMQPAKRGRKAAVNATSAMDRYTLLGWAARRQSTLTFEIAFGASAAKQRISAKGACAAFVALACDLGTLLEVEVADASDEVPEATVIEIAKGPRAGWSSRTLELAEAKVLENLGLTGTPAAEEPQTTEPADGDGEDLDGDEGEAQA